MNLQDIATNFRKLHRCDIEGWGDPLDNVLEGLFGEIIALDYRCRFAELLDRTRIAVYTLFDLPHHSDESCEMHVLVVDDKPVGIAFKFADKSSWNSRIIDADHYKVVALELAAASITARLRDVTVEALEELRNLDNSYIHFLDEKETMFAVRSPKNMLGFQHMLKKHRAFFVDETGAVSPVSAIGKYSNAKPSHCGDEDTHEVLITAGTTERKVDGQQLMFEMIPGEGDIESALGSYAKEPFWFVKTIHERVCRAQILMQIPNRWSTSTAWVDFESKEEMQRFAIKYFDEEESKLVFGTFCPKSLGFKGEISY
jgi:hypothetical protein